MIDREHELPITRQVNVLNISRGSVYYKPRPVPAGALAIMRRIDELHLDHPFAGSRMLRDMLSREGIATGRQRVASLMKRMGIEALYRKPNTSKPTPGHKIYPYLLRGLKVERPNQVWATDITYIAMARGFVYLTAVVDWFTRRVLSHRVSITMEAGFCIEALEEAPAKHGRPEIFNSDQGSQFTSEAFTGVLIENKIAISMDGKGAQAATMSSSSASGNRSNTKRCICAPMPASPMPGHRLAGIWTSTTGIVRIRALTGRRPMRLTSIIRRRAPQHELRRVFGVQLQSGYALLASHLKNASHRQRKPGRSPLIDQAKLFRHTRPALGGSCH